MPAALPWRCAASRRSWGMPEMLEQLSPGAWMYNFTNPAGLVTQALRDAGFERTIGICDGANAGQGSLALGRVWKRAASGRRCSG